MNKNEFIEKIRELLLKYVDDCEWYRDCQCNHLFELSIIKRRTVWEILNIIENSENANALIETLKLECYKSDSIDYYVQKNLINLAEFASIRVNTIHNVIALASKFLDDFN